jgi:epoxyqueuosine reductase
MNNAIRQRAYELGFDACRITHAGVPDHAADFERWLAAGRHGEMAYLQRNASKRVDPGQVLPDARSVICLAASYAIAAPVPEATSTSGARGVVARYARFADYHEVMGSRMRDLAGFVDALGGAGTRSLWYVDTGPVLERDLAQRAGLGFIGKHTNLISRELGNWFFLGEILTTLPLETDVPEKNHCGTCARCLAACPTQAIVAPFELDARRCISYLTIELKGDIPEELRPAIGNHLFGCDDCLAVCPWNRFAREGALMKPHLRPDLEQPELLALLELDDAGFRRRFEGTPVQRIKRRGLLRNVCVALGNVGDTGALAGLERAARDPESLVARHARWALERIEARQRGETGPMVPSNCPTEVARSG